MANEQDEVIVDDVEETNEEVEENTEETTNKTAKPKRTPQEEYDYHRGRTERLARKLGIKDKVEPVKNTSTDKPSELDYGQKAFLKAYGISGSEELALIKQFQDRGFGLDSIVEDDVFTAKLTNLREAKASQDAIPKGKGRSAQVASTNIDLAYAKFKETGEWPQDFDIAKKLKDKIVEAEQGTASIYSKK